MSVCPGLRGCPGHGSFRAETGRVLGNPSRRGAPRPAHTTVAGMLPFTMTGGWLEDGRKEKMGFGHRPGEGRGGWRRGDRKASSLESQERDDGPEPWLPRRPAGSQAQRPPRRSTGFLPRGSWRPPASLPPLLSGGLPALVRTCLCVFINPES